MAIYKNGKKIENIYVGGKKVSKIYHAGGVIYQAKPAYKIVDFATGTDDEIAAMLEAHYRGDINIGDHWHVGDTRVMQLSAMPATPPYASEAHATQNMTMVIIGIEHDNLKTPINGKVKAAITLQCREALGNNGSGEYGYIWGRDTSTEDTDNYSNNPRRNWLNNTFVSALPNVIQPLIKTIIKKNINGHSLEPNAGPNTEDKAFLTSYPEMFGNTRFSDYEGSPALEGEQYSYYNSNARRIKKINNNGTASGNTTNYWLRSPGTVDSDSWIYILSTGSAYAGDSGVESGLAPAFCL